MLLHHVTLIVDDLQAALAFYVGELGLGQRRVDGLDYPGAFLTLGNGQEVHLAALPDRSPSFRAHFCLRVDNWNGLFRRYHAADRLDLQPWGKVRQLPDGAYQCYVRDPAGNLVELTSFPEDRAQIDPTVKELDVWGGEPFGVNK